MNGVIATSSKYQCNVRQRSNKFLVGSSRYEGGLLSAIQQQTQISVREWVQQQQQTIATAAERVARIVQPKPSWLPRGPSGDVTLRLTQNPIEFLNEFRDEYGGVGGVIIGGEYAIMVGDSSIAKQVLVDNSHCYQKEGTALFPGPDLAGQGLLVTDGEVWKKQRRISNPAFRGAAINSYRSIMQQIINNWINQKEDKPYLICDMYQEMNQLTLQVVLACLFGSQVEDQEGGNTVESTKIAFQYFATRSPIMPMWFPTWDNFSYLSAVKRLDKTVYGLISQRRMLKKQNHFFNNGNQCDLLDELLGSEEADDLLIRDQLMTFLIAGQETSAIVISWALALLVSNQRIQQELYYDIQQGNNRFTIAVLLETMRLYPPAYMVGRCASLDTELDNGTKLKQGTSVFVSPYLLHRDESVWQDPSTFNPERWLDDLGENNNYAQVISKLSNQGVYIPFGAGPRNCIGAGFAMEELILLINTLCLEFQLLPHIDDWQMPKTQPFITLRPENFQLKLLKREK